MFNVIVIAVSIWLATVNTKITYYSFALMAIINTLIGIIQEIRAKLTIDKLSLLRVMVGQPSTDENWSDNVLLSYLKLAGEKIINRAYPYDDTVTEVPRRYGALQCEIASYLLNKRGAEGQTSHSENGVNRTYENADVPESLMSNVTPFIEVM
jgi:hypothetical protein